MIWLKDMGRLCKEGERKDYVRRREEGKGKVKGAGEGGGSNEGLGGEERWVREEQSGGRRWYGMGK